MPDVGLPGPRANERGGRPRTVVESEGVRGARPDQAIRRVGGVRGSRAALTSGLRPLSSTRGWFGSVCASSHACSTSVALTLVPRRNGPQAVQPGRHGRPIRAEGGRRIISAQAVNQRVVGLRDERANQLSCASDSIRDGAVSRETAQDLRRTRLPNDHQHLPIRTRAGLVRTGSGHAEALVAATSSVASWSRVRPA